MISKETFDTEISMCQKMFKETGGCAWGRCQNCGAPLLLQKLHKAEVIEGKEAIEKFKAKIFE